MEITLKINRRTKFGKYFYNLIKMTALSNKEVKILDMPNKTTQKAIEEINRGKVKTVKDSEELFKELGI